MNDTKVLFILSSYNLYGGTSKKTLDLLNHFGRNAVLYVYSDSYSEFKSEFKSTEAKVYEGNHGRNVLKHFKELMKIIDNEQINIIQTQFTLGETLGFLIKLFNPKIKLVVAFVSAFEPNVLKKIIANLFYYKADAIVYISNFVKTAKQKQFPLLRKKKVSVIYNGTRKREDIGETVTKFNSPSILAIAGLIHLKNIQVLVKAMNILVNEMDRVLFLYIVGDGPYKESIVELINEYNLSKYFFLLGYQKNIGRMLDNCTIFVHPSYAEGFGIVVAEAMLSEKSIIVSNAGALPELIVHKKTGLIVDPHDPEEWANAIEYMIDNPNHAMRMAGNAKKDAEKRFSVEIYAKNYEKLYRSLLQQ